MFGKNLAIVDIETTGMSANHNRIIEIAIIRIEKNTIVDKYTTLVNPQTHVSSFIIDFTGISKEELDDAPVFDDIKERVFEILSDAVFVAHNVRFDYSFVKSELRRTGIPFKAKTCCTVRLSRKLFPQHTSHSLQSVIERFNLDFIHRHRAYDDAHVLWQFLQKINKTVPKDQFQKAWDALTKSLYAGDENIKKQIEALPEEPGVYMFFDKNDAVLYVGKSTNISDRVISHFSEDSTSAKHLEMMKAINRIEYIRTSGELGALITESQLVKKLNPVYNHQLKGKKYFFVLTKQKNKNGYFILKNDMIENLDDVDYKNILGIFGNKKNVKEYVSNLASSYSLCEKLLGSEDTKSSCFGYKLGKCKGACINKENVNTYNARFLIAFIENKHFRPWPFSGPVEITETNEENETWECFTFDNWCLTNKKNNKGDEEVYEYRFDTDNYRIFSRYLKNKKYDRNIKILK